MIDTKQFDDLKSNQYKKQTQANWTSAPCGSNYSLESFLSKKYFDEITKHRYITHPWIINTIKSFNIMNKNVLEIGYGMGTDHLSLAQRDAIMHGIDITPKNAGVTSRRFELYGHKSELITGDAENMPYDSNTFNFIYSFGVIHHSPNTNKIVSEVYRILKPGGKCWITVYNKDSIYFWWSVFFCGWLLNGDYKKETIKQRISRIEYPNNNPNLVIKLYKKKEFKNLFYEFSTVKTSVYHLRKEDIRYFGRFIPQNILNKIGEKLGWYIIIEATK